MPADQLVSDLTLALAEIPLIDPHSHIDPLDPVAGSLDDILGYHYYTELAHSSGMSQEPLAKSVSPRERVRAIVQHMDRYDNTAQYAWFLDIARTFLGFTGNRITASDADKLFDAAEKTFRQKDWEKQVRTKTNLEKIFLTNEFDDPLDNFDTSVYVPCLRTDTLVFHLDRTDTRERIDRATGIKIVDAGSLRKAIAALFLHFTRKGAKACAISLPPDFEPAHYDDEYIYEQIRFHDCRDIAPGVFWIVAEFCREFKLPFDLMIGVNRRVYVNGVYQGQDLFDQRTSLIQYRRVFNAFPEVMFPVSVLTSAQNQELVAYSWIFPNVVPNGHWWYSNVPPYIRKDLGERLSAVPKTKLIGYYSDAYKLEFVLPKYAMYRRVLANVLADEYVRPGSLNETQAVALGRRLLRDNVKEIFKV
jgi:glucuronate isomerase